MAAEAYTQRVSNAMTSTVMYDANDPWASPRQMTTAMVAAAEQRQGPEHGGRKIMEAELHVLCRLRSQAGRLERKRLGKHIRKHRRMAEHLRLKQQPSEATAGGAKGIYYKKALSSHRPPTTLQSPGGVALHPANWPNALHGFWSAKFGQVSSEVPIQR